MCIPSSTTEFGSLAIEMTTGIRATGDNKLQIQIYPNLHNVVDLSINKHERVLFHSSFTFPGVSNFLQIVEWAFGKRMTPAERLRKHQRSLEKTQRELDRERVKLENQEKKLIQEIKKSAKNGQMGACKIQAKDLVRTRRYIEKFYAMRTQLQAISLRIQVCLFLC